MSEKRYIKIVSGELDGEPGDMIINITDARSICKKKNGDIVFYYAADHQVNIHNVDKKVWDMIQERCGIPGDA